MLYKVILGLLLNFGNASTGYTKHELPDNCLIYFVKSEAVLCPHCEPNPKCIYLQLKSQRICVRRTEAYVLLILILMNSQRFLLPERDLIVVMGAVRDEANPKECLC